MKQFLALCVMATLVGCGTSLSPSEPEELGTLEAAVCGKGSCPLGYYYANYYCDGACPDANNCNNSFNAVTCVAGDLSGPISICNGGCPSGYYVAAISETADCRPGALSPPGGANRRDCSVNPAPGAVSSYTVCNTGATCATGYHRGSTTHVDACYFSGLNATICLAN